MSAISINNISKAYGKVVALNNVSLEVQRGELFGLIGPDGAGKTTLFKILVTLIDPDSGNATVDSLDIASDYKKVRTRVGYMPGKFSLYPDLTVDENLTFFANLFGGTIEDNYHLIEPIYRQIEPFKTRRAGRLSGGMKQKLALCCALIHKPSVLFLDEPTTGVDAVSRREFWDMLDDLKQQGLSILVSTPYMDEAGRCDRIALINNGKILDIDSPESMIQRFDSHIYGIKANNMFQLMKAMRELSEIDNCYTAGEYHHFVTSLEINTHDLMQNLNDKGFDNIVINEITPDIEDIFIKHLSNEQQ